MLEKLVGGRALWLNTTMRKLQPKKFYNIGTFTVVIYECYHKLEYLSLASLYNCF
jgi:hypothetical protein